MKKLNIILSFMLAVIIAVMPAIGFAEDNTVYAVNEIDRDIAGVLKSLGIIDPETVEQSAYASKTDFLNGVLNMLGVSGIENDEMPYTDVLPGTEEYTVISRAIAIGLIEEKTGEFGALDPLTKEFAAQVFGAASGYTKAFGKNAVEKRPILYNELFKGVGTVSASGLDVAQLYKVLYNMLTIDVYKPVIFGDNYVSYKETENVSVIGIYRKIYEVRGRVTANEETALSGRAADKGRIRIGDAEYTLRDASLADGMLGRYVKAYVYIDDDIKEIQCIINDINNGKTLYIDSDKLHSFKNGVITYDQSSGRKTTQTVSSKAVLIYNGKKLEGSEIKDSLFVNMEGSIELVANSGGVYDVVIITNYENILVNMVDFSEEIIYDRNKAGNSISLRGHNYKVIGSDGKELTLRDIQGNTLITYTMSANLTGEKYIVIYVNSKAVVSAASGRFTKGGIQHITIDGTDYGFSKSVQMSAESIKLGRKYNFYIDYRGKIGAVRTADGINGSLGYFLGVAAQGAFDTDVQAAVLTADGKKNIYSFARNVKIDGVTCKSGQKIIEAMKNGAAEYTRIPAIYRLNTEGKLVEIDTPYTNALENEDEVLTKTISMSEGAQYIKTMGTYPFKNNIGSKTIARLDTMIVIEDGAGETEVVAKLGNDKRFPLDVYSLGKDAPTCEFVLVKDTGNITYTYNDIMYVFNEKIKVYDSETGAAVTKVVMGESMVNKEFTLNEEKLDLFDKVEIGDIVRIAQNTSGEIMELDHIYDYSEKKVLSSNPTSDFTSNQAFRLVMGDIFIIKDTAISYYTPIEGLDTMSAEDRMTAIKAKLETNFIREDRMYAYKVVRDSVVEYTKLNMNEIRTYKESGLDNDRVIIRTSYCTPAEFFIIR